MNRDDSRSIYHGYMLDNDSFNYYSAQGTNLGNDVAEDALETYLGIKFSDSASGLMGVLNDQTGQPVNAVGGYIGGALGMAIDQLIKLEENAKTIVQLANDPNAWMPSTMGTYK